MPKSKNPSKRVEIVRGSYNLFVFDTNGKQVLNLVVSENIEELANVVNKISENLEKKVE